MNDTPSEVVNSATMGKLTETARDLIERQLHVHGALLFRGMPLHKADDFSRFMYGLGFKLRGYHGGTGLRHSVADNVMTSSDDDPSTSMEPHNEMAYGNNYPYRVKKFGLIRPMPTMLLTTRLIVYGLTEISQMTDTQPILTMVMEVK